MKLACGLRHVFGQVKPWRWLVEIRCSHLGWKGTVCFQLPHRRLTGLSLHNSQDVGQGCYIVFSLFEQLWFACHGLAQ